MCSVRKKGLKLASKNLRSILALEFGAAHNLIGLIVISRKKRPQQSSPITAKVKAITVLAYLADTSPILKRFKKNFKDND